MQQGITDPIVAIGFAKTHAMGGMSDDLVRVAGAGGRDRESHGAVQRGEAAGGGSAGAGQGHRDGDSFAIT